MLPKVEIYLHEHPRWVTARWLENVRLVMPRLVRTLLAAPPGPQHVLSTLERVEVSVVDDASIARVHGDFLHDPTPTDVITFPYGEILVSSDTAARYAAAHSIPPTEELFRYIVHGLTHLHGYLDDCHERRDALFAVQEPIVAAFCPSATLPPRAFGAQIPRNRK